MPLAIFDLDHTLINGDSASLWAEFCVDAGLMDNPDFLRQSDNLYADYEAGTLDIHAYMSHNLKPIIGYTDEKLAPLLSTFLESVIEPCIYREGEALLQKHRTQGDTLLLISATGAHLVEPIGRRLGVDVIMAIDLEKNAQCFTGNITGIPTFREGKVERLQAWLQAHNESMNDSWFYSDSFNDLPLLEEATFPVAINPDSTLRGIAENRGWSIMQLSS